MTNTDINDKTQTIKEELDTLLEHSDELVKRIEDDVRAHSKEEAKHIVLPMIPMRHMNVFPGVSLTFEVARKRSRAAVHAAMNSDEQRMFLVSQRSLSVEWPRDDDIFHVGTQVRIREMIQLPGREVLRVRVDGLERARLISRESAVKDDEWDQATIQLMPSSTEKGVDPLQIEAGRRELLRSFQLYAATSGRLSMDAIMTLNALDNPAEQTDIIASNLNLSFEEQQSLLETPDILKRQSMLITFLEREIVISEYENELSEKVKAEVDKSQKEYYLREQMKVIRRELGDEQDTQEEVERYLEKLKNTPVPEDYREKLEKEIKRLTNYPVSFPEAANLRTYLDTVFDLPWGEMSEETGDIKKVRQQLDADHYGLQDVKERILEYMAVRELHHTQTDEPFKAPILCFVGPPGVGKTSIAQSIAQSINRRFVRMSLGGIKDEAEIRGHRRTYIGAIPGRIIAAIQQAKTDNPLILLDEIDKLGNDFRGDPASALLEVLDPEQNYNFRDHYLEVPYDLSHVMFITTANTTDTIPRALLDRMEVIELSGYTEEEKYHIAKLHLLPKQIGLNALQSNQLTVSKRALMDVIRLYTKEAGVRQLERELSKLCRRGVLRLKEKDEDKQSVTMRNLDDFLGKPKYRYDVIDKEDPVGVVTGLAWTAVGGDTLSIEVGVSSGSGKVELTGSLGDVMKESAKVSLAYIRSREDVHTEHPEFPEKMDIHVHVPEGAVPKDGPSAGVTLATAIYSALMQKPVHHDLAMTGELTIRGRVLPIGGIKEKIIAAHRAGVKRVLIPEENKRDIEDIPESVLKDLDVITVTKAEEVLNYAIV
ncbi:MAG: endopeptidase La [Fastidiosipilaceae bacterium]